ncbi:hypothetical protein JKG47_19055 [Acidithiobacillus sp. MC6.1]|nr:hypothetical protein [Acidithiobacillus sp. MC6.1]
MPMLFGCGVTDRQYGATDVRRNGAISKCLKWGDVTAPTYVEFYAGNS